MADENPDKLADELEGEADTLERHGAEMEQRTDEVRKDWEQKRADPNVPGALPPEGGEDPS